MASMSQLLSPDIIRCQPISRRPGKVSSPTVLLQKMMPKTETSIEYALVKLLPSLLVLFALAPSNIWNLDLFLVYPAFPTWMDINQNARFCPSNFFSFITEHTQNLGVSAVTIKENFFLGHFHERSIMPGVLMVEVKSLIFKSYSYPSCWLGYACNLKWEAPERIFGSNRQRFRKPVVAGDTLATRMTLIKLQRQFGIGKMEGMAYIVGDVVCEGEFLTATGSE